MDYDEYTPEELAYLMNTAPTLMEKRQFLILLAERTDGDDDFREALENASTIGRELVEKRRERDGRS